MNVLLGRRRGRATCPQSTHAAVRCEAAYLVNAARSLQALVPRAQVEDVKFIGVTGLVLGVLQIDGPDPVACIDVPSSEFRGLSARKKSSVAPHSNAGSTYLSLTIRDEKDILVDVVVILGERYCFSFCKHKGFITVLMHLLHE